MDTQELTTTRKLKHTIPLKAAIKATKRWRKEFIKILGKKSKANDEAILRSFYIPKADINAMFDRHGADGARAYLCVKQAEAGLHQNQFHILVVPVKEVDGHKRDMLEYKDPDSDQMLSSVYDFTSPCPSTCDDTSDLY